MGLARLTSAAACLAAIPAVALAQADTTAPETTLTLAPSGYNTSVTPRFDFTSDDPSATFECSLDGAPFSACSSPHTSAPIAVGKHTFRVRARDAAGNADATPAEAEWRHVRDARPPRVTFNGPSTQRLSRISSFSGTTVSSSRVVKVDVALRVYGRRKEDDDLSLLCQWLDLETGRPKTTFCLKPPYERAKGGKRWRLALTRKFLKAAPPGLYVLQVRAVNEVVAGKIARRRIELKR